MIEIQWEEDGMSKKELIKTKGYDKAENREFYFYSEFIPAQYRPLFTAKADVFAQCGLYYSPLILEDLQEWTWMECYACHFRIDARDGLCYNIFETHFRVNHRCPHLAQFAREHKQKYGYFPLWMSSQNGQRRRITARRQQD